MEPELTALQRSHKVTLFLSIDGNFRLQLKMKNRTGKDPELFNAFFVPHDIFEAYRKGTINDLEVRCSCW